jgi:diguanylate cyclase (GGDEF)-like protein
MHASHAREPQPGIAHRYRALLEIGRTLAGTLGSSELYEAVYRETVRVMEASGFFISLYDEGSDEATVVFFADRGEVKHDVAIRYPGAQSRVLRERQAMLVRQGLEELAVERAGDAEAELTRSAVSAPMIHKGRLLGAVSAQSYRENAYTEEDLDLLRGIADIAGVALDNARHVAELEARRREAETMEEIGRALAGSLDPRDVLGTVVDAVTTVLPVDGAAVWLWEEEEPGEEPVARVSASHGTIALPEGLAWPLDEHLAERIVARREAVVMDDLAADQHVPGPVREHLQAGSGAAVPLLVGGAVAGFLAAGSRQTHHFREREVVALRRLASQASVALKNARMHTSLQALSLTDPLTGLPNRRHLEIHLEKEVAAARRGRSLVVVVFDLDDFKRYNDSLGHVAGDEILRAFADVLHDENRAMNMVARYGGDEFVSVLSESYLEGARLFAKRVVDSVAASPLLARHGVTVSSGLAEFDPATMSSATEVLHAADADMYRIKARRRSAARSRSLLSP